MLYNDIKVITTHAVRLLIFRGWFSHYRHVNIIFLIGLYCDLEFSVITVFVILFRDIHTIFYWIFRLVWLNYNINPFYSFYDSDWFSAVIPYIL